MRTTYVTLAASLLLGALVVGAQADVSIPRIVATYTTPTTLKVALGDGTPVQSGTVIPAGSYQIVVNDDPNTGDLNPQFIVTGPGVNVNSDLNNTGMGIDGSSSFGPYAFQTSSGYSIQDKNIGASTLITFTTTATATANAQTTTTTTTTRVARNTPTIVVKPTVLGTLVASIPSSGKPTLTFHGKAVKKLAPGRYTVAIKDRSKTSGLLLGHGSGRPSTLSSGASVGASSRPVTLTAGKWFFETSTGGPKTSFSVL